MDEKPKLNGKEEHAHINPAYVHEEGRGEAGPDTRSSESSSSLGSTRSSMKILTTKLKVQGRTRWVALAVVVLVAVVLIIAITTTVYFTTSGTEGVSMSQMQAGEPKGSNNTTLTTETPITATTKFTRSVTSRTTTTRPTALTTRYTTSAPVVVDRTTPSNLSVSMSDVLYSPVDTAYQTLNCLGRHSGGWNSLTIRRQFKDSYEPVAALQNQGGNKTDVHVFYPNMTFYKIVFNYEMTLSVTFEDFACWDLTNFTCALDTQDGIVTEKAKVSIYMTEPEIQLPHAIVEDRVVTFSCFSEVWGYGGSLSWKIKPLGSTTFMDFSVAPTVTETKNNCTKTITSRISLSPTMYENGSVFRCELQTDWVNPQVVQTTASETTLFVVPSNYCDDKREFTIHPHPHGACTLVIYCLSGPLVYEIECDKGQCYDSKKTACVPKTT